MTQEALLEHGGAKRPEDPGLRSRPSPGSSLEEVAGREGSSGKRRTPPLPLLRSASPAAPAATRGNARRHGQCQCSHSHTQGTSRRAVGRRGPLEARRPPSAMRLPHRQGRGAEDRVPDLQGVRLVLRPAPSPATGLPHLPTWTGRGRSSDRKPVASAATPPGPQVLCLNPVPPRGNLAGPREM